MEIPRHKTIHERCELFLSRLPKTKDRTPEVERLMRLIYWVGVSHMNDFMTSELTVLSEDEGIVRIERVQQELREFGVKETMMQRFIDLGPAVKH